jgi:hypothetical protein
LNEEKKTFLLNEAQHARALCMCISINTHTHHELVYIALRATPSEKEKFVFSTDDRCEFTRFSPLNFLLHFFVLAAY